MKTKGQFELICRDAQGREKWREAFPNGTTNAGINYLLEAGLKDGTKLTAWFIGLISSAGFAALSSLDTMASHGGWAEFTAYDEANRQAWDGGAVASQSVDNSASPAVFTFAAPAVIRGTFLVSNGTKGGTTGTLFSTALFSAAQSVVASDTITATYAASVSAG